MRPHRSLLVAAIAVIATSLAACGTTEDSGGDGSSADDKIILKDARGKTVTLDGPAVRVAGTEWNVTEYLVSLGVQPVGVSDIKGFETWDSAVELDGRAKDIGTRGEPSLDTLATLNLDAVFVTDDLVEGAIAQIEKTTPVIVVPGGDSKDPIGQMFENLGLVAKATGTEDKAKDLRSQYDAAIEDAKATVAKSDDAGSTVAFTDAYDTGDSVFIRPFTEGSQLGAVLKEMGFKNGWNAVEGIEGDAVYGLAQTDVEGLTKLPDDTKFWYIGGANDPDVYGEVLEDNRVWKSLPFVTEGNVERYPNRIWMFGGPKSMIQFIEATLDKVA